MFNKKYIFILLALIFSIYSCRKITEPPVNNNYNDILFTSDRDGNNNVFKLNLNNLLITQLTFEGDNTSPQISPDNKYIYFNSSGDICRMDLDGNNIFNITNSPSTEYEFSISSDGRKIAFVSDRNSTPQELYRSEIYFINSDGSSIRRISYSKFYSGSPYLSSTGKLAYHSFDYDSIKFSIHLYSLDDSSDTVITPKGLSQEAPVFSHDGKYLSFFSRDDMSLYLLDLQTGIRKKIIFGKEQKFSSDDKYLYFISTGKGDLDVFKYDILNDIMQNITNSQEEENSFDVSPDGQKIVMSAYINSDSSFISQLFINYINSGKRERLTNDIFNNFNPVFIKD